MPSLRRPSQDRIAACLDVPDAPLSYSEVGASALRDEASQRALSRRYDLDDLSLPLGRGEPCYARACEALFGWRQFEVPWVSLHGGERAAHAGQVVATLSRFAGLWFLNRCRVVYVEPPDAECAAFAYGTLPGHVECGEERFEVTLDPGSGEVHYRISAFSRPASWTTRLGYPLARRVQRRFALASARALARAVAERVG